MRKLNEHYWNKFVKLNVDENKRDGVLFEDLIEYILTLEYGHEWIRTSKSHDNNRDFYLTTSDFSYWAECKNHKKSIALDTVAPTLVMAQIFEVNKIIFFSYSDINSSAKNKIISFGDKTKKQIDIYSGNTLDELIIKHRKFLPSNFAPQSKDINTIGCTTPLEYNFYFVQNPILGVNVKNKDITPVPEATKIIYNTAFEIAFICTNNTLENDYEIELTLDSTYGKDNHYFTLINYPDSCQSNVFEKKTLPVAGGILNKYYFKSNRFRPFLTLPVFEVRIKKAGHLITQFQSPVKWVQNDWIGKTILIGEHYRNAIKIMEQTILNNEQCSCFLVHGSSGTGKTRLLKESVEVLLKHHYRIVNFIGNEDDSAYVLLKELIYYVYEVPRDDILKGMENEIFALSQESSFSPAHQAYQLAQRFSKAKTDEELIQVIEECFDIIYEKISQSRLAIVIDNIQFFGDAMIHFLHKYVMYSIHQTRMNHSVLILSINEDYITEKTNTFFRYIQHISHDSTRFKCCNITGFHDVNQGILFLRELLHIGDERLDEEFKLILSKSTLKPYYIYQAVYYLYEKNAIVEVDNEKGYFPCMEIFHAVIHSMPQKIVNIISERWAIFLDKNKNYEIAIIEIIAFVYLFRELNSDIIKQFHLDPKSINLLLRRMFIKLNDNGNYCFDHDIIEEFFTSYYHDLADLVINKIRKLHMGRKLSNYYFVNLYYQLWNKQLTFQKLHKIYGQTIQIAIPSRLSDLYYKKFLEIALKTQTKDQASEEWMSLNFNICNLCKNGIGIEKSIPLFESVNHYLDTDKLTEIIYTKTFRNYLNVYADALFYQTKYNKAILYLEKIKSILPDIDNDQIYALKAMINNRLLINYRELPSQYHQNLSLKCLADAQKAVDKLRDPLLKDEFTYLNISDEGYYYYCLRTQKKELLNIWNQCMNYPPERLPQKAMNYYRKCLQLELIKQNYQNVFNILAEANDYMELHYSGATEKLVFKLSFSIFKIMAWIQENPIANKPQLFAELSHAIELSYLLAKRNLKQLLLLKAIVCCYNNDIIGTYYQYKEAYLLYAKKQEARFYQEKKQLLLSNIYVSFLQLGMLKKAKDFLSAEDQVYFNSLQIELSGYEADGIQRTSDKLYNLPAV